MGKKQQHRSLRSKAVHLVSDFTTVLLNPISDKASKTTRPPPEEDSESKKSQHQSAPEENSQDNVDEPDTSSFTAFLYSLLSSSETGDKSKHDQKNEYQEDMIGPSSDSSVKETSGKETAGKKSLISRGKQSIGKAFYHAARIGGYKSQSLERKSNSDNAASGKGSIASESEGIPMKTLNESLSSISLPETSEPSLLLSEKIRNAVYIALPSLVQGRKWVLLYSTWRHGISLTTLYRRSMLWPGTSLLAVGDRKGAVFGGLVEAPLRPTSKRRYQGTNNSFVFTNTPGQPVIFRPTGMNRYFTLCSPEFLALGGGGHFALYLDGDLLNGSSSASETYGNSCLAHSEDFEVKEIELWGFVYDSKYEETVSLLRTEAPGICRW
ncbi:TLD domain-containing protein 2 isoform X2 [Impatiens glandulifera]|uniref:TLD domain-containing protein 2 isoform X2 n=1 Tax=Impatiens glandulifera TaxID=253017 RepID=UPI001FB0EA6E|nr:TLD domain-containing protein 2 isoform X2 [Impatiens glandulifera]